MDWTWAGLFGLEGPDRSTQATSRIPTVTSRDSNQQTVKFVKTILTRLKKLDFFAGLFLLTSSRVCDAKARVIIDPYTFSFRLFSCGFITR